MSKSREIVHAYQTRKNGTAVLVIPKPIRDELGISTGDEFLVRREGEDRIIYRRLSGNKHTSPVS
jgi:AbrB family looped-hinge helix DNA binding protein